MFRRPLAWWINVARALVALLAAIGVISIGAGNPAGLTTDTDTSTVTETKKVEAPPQVVVADTDNQLSPAEAKDDASKATSGGLDLHEDARDETPPGVSPAELAAGAKATEKIAEKTLVAPQQPAGAQNYRCTWHPVVNYSNLTHRIIGVAMHFTVSPPGSLPGIHNLFNTRSFGASSTYGYELFSNVCWQFVSLDKKAWAQLSANSYYWSIELVTNDRTRAEWLATPALWSGKLAALVADLLKKAGAPPVLVDPKGCVFLPGLTDHSRLECGNTHWDVGKNFPWDVFIREVREHYYGADYKPACGKTCRNLRGRHAQAHKDLERVCRQPAGRRRHPKVCRKLAARNSYMHRYARQHKFSLAR